MTLTNGDERDIVMPVERVIVVLGTLIILLFFLLSAARANDGFLSWRDWYPLDRGQAPGERALNWWLREEEGLNDRVFGQSTWSTPHAPAAFPKTFDGRHVDYFYNWQCGPPTSIPGHSYELDPECEHWGIYLEYMSEGTATGDDTYLEHWARGGRGLDLDGPLEWEVYYAPDAFSACSSASLAAETAASLQRPEIKAPLIMRLPNAAGAEYVGPVVCTVIFDDYYQHPDNVIAEKTGLWFVVTRTLDRYVDEDGLAVVEAENRYYTTSESYAAPFDAWCASTEDPNYCQMEGDQWRASTREQDGVTGRLFAFEQYWMRQVPAGDRLQNGFGAFRWWTWDSNDLAWDDVQIWETDTCTPAGDEALCAAQLFKVHTPIVSRLGP